MSGDDFGAFVPSFSRDTGPDSCWDGDDDDVPDFANGADVASFDFAFAAAVAEVVVEDDEDDDDDDDFVPDRLLIRNPCLSDTTVHPNGSSMRFIYSRAPCACSIGDTASFCMSRSSPSLSSSSFDGLVVVDGCNGEGVDTVAAEAVSGDDGGVDPVVGPVDSSR